MGIIETKELRATLDELRTGLITTNMAMEQILIMFGFVPRLLCDRNVTTCNYFSDGKCKYTPSECKYQIVK